VFAKAAGRPIERLDDPGDAAPVVLLTPRAARARSAIIVMIRDPGINPNRLGPGAPLRFGVTGDAGRRRRLGRAHEWTVQSFPRSDL